MILNDFFAPFLPMRHWRSSDGARGLMSLLLQNPFNCHHAPRFYCFSGDSRPLVRGRRPPRPRLLQPVYRLEGRGQKREDNSEEDSACENGRPRPPLRRRGKRTTEAMIKKTYPKTIFYSTRRAHAKKSAGFSQIFPHVSHGR